MPGSMVMVWPGSKMVSEVAEMNGFSWISSPSPWPVPWP